MAKSAPSAAAAPAAGGSTPPIAAPAAAPAAPAASGGGLKALLPALATIIVAPAVTFAVAQFVLVPRFQKQLAATPLQAAAGADDHESGGEGKGKDGKEADAPNYEFQNVVVNLAGTMGTRYLKTSFLVTGEPTIKRQFEENKPRLTDVTLNVLSSLSLADLEEPGAKNVLREKLVAAYNQALGKKVADQVYFSDFVVQ